MDENIAAQFKQEAILYIAARVPGSGNLSFRCSREGVMSAQQT